MADVYWHVQLTSNPSGLFYDILSCPLASRGKLSRLGFTLVEILVALTIAGLLTAMIATLFSRGIATSSGLQETTQAQHSRIVLYRLLSMDLRSMLPAEELVVTEQGFSLATGHNHLLPSPLPMTVAWDFSGQRVQRTEALPELAYTQELTLISELRDWSLALYDLTDNQWVDVRSWLHGGQRPAPGGVRLELRPAGQHAPWIFIHRLPLEEDAPL